MQELLFTTCSKQIMEYSAGKRQTPLELPVGLEPCQRKALHAVAAALGLNSYSIGPGSFGSCEKRVVVDRHRAWEPVLDLTGEEAVGYLVENESGVRGYVEGFVPRDKDDPLNKPNKWWLVYEIENTSRTTRSSSAATASCTVREEVDLATLNAALKRRWYTTQQSAASTNTAQAQAPGFGEGLDKLLDELLEGCDDDWATSEWSQIKYDLRHFLGIWSTMVSASKTSILFKIFMVTSADVFSKLNRGEMERIIHHCRTLGMTYDQISCLRRRYWRRHARTHCPEPKQLIREAYDVYMCFKDLQDPERPGCRFLLAESEAEAIFRKCCAHIQLGILSDPPGMVMYVWVQNKFRSLRSTSMLEGYHLHLRLVIHCLARHASLRYKAALVDWFDYRWNVKSLIRAKILPHCGHFFLWLRDQLCDIVEGTPLEKMDIACLRGWKRLDTSRVPIVPRGVIHCERRPLGPSTMTVKESAARRAAVSKAMRHSNTPSWKWLEAVTGRQLPSRLRRSDQIATTLPHAAASANLAPHGLFERTELRVSERCAWVHA